MVYFALIISPSAEAFLRPGKDMRPLATPTSKRFARSLARLDPQQTPLSPLPPFNSSENEGLLAKYHAYRPTNGIRRSHFEMFVIVA